MTKNTPATATNTHISIVGHITRDELLRDLDRTEQANGFGNRFLWVCVRRSKALPEGGALWPPELDLLLPRLLQAREFVKTVKRLDRTPEARALWDGMYRQLSDGAPGLLGAMTARAEAQVMRLACLYAPARFAGTPPAPRGSARPLGGGPRPVAHAVRRRVHRR
jgi:hypothetical protein